MKHCLLKEAEVSIGRERKSHANWFLESASTILPLIEAKNKAHENLLQSESVSHRQEFRPQQRLIKSAVDNAKKNWIQRVALESEEAVRDGRQDGSALGNSQPCTKDASQQDQLLREREQRAVKRP